MRSELENALRLARDLLPEELPRLLGELEEIRTTAIARLSSPPVQPAPDELLDVEKAAQRLGVSPDYLYHHHKELPFTRRMGRSLLFSSLGIDKHVRSKR